MERYTENLVLHEMKCVLGDNGWGYVYPQGDVSSIDKIEKLLKKAGGKPKHCILDDFSQGGKGKAKPEYIITLKDDANTIIVVECKNSVNKHRSENLNCPRGFAVDGVLYYSKFLKEEFNVIAVAVSGTSTAKMKVNAFHWAKGQDTYLPLNKATDIILEPKNYIRLIKGEKLQKDYSLDEIRETAIEMHNSLRDIAVREEHKPIFIAGVLIALNNEDFSNSYRYLPSYNAIMSSIQTAIESELKKGDIPNDRLPYIRQVFTVLQDNKKFSKIPLIEKHSIRWYIEQLEMKIKPMMNYADSTIDALGVFYHEFIKYSGGDGSGLGIVLTPQHLTEFMCELAGVNKNSKVVDICCGSGAFLVTAMSKMFKDANPIDVERIRKEQLFGVEQDDGLYTLAITNMIIRQDGKSNIYKDDCFNSEIVKKLKRLNINIGLINPPYSLKGKNSKTELEFVEQLLDILTVGGIGVAVVPTSCAIGTKFKEVRERLLKKHTLKAVFSMPDDIFSPFNSSTCVMIWEAKTPHDSTNETFFGFYKNDGFVKRKKLGRIDYYNKWPDILAKWLKLYRNRQIIDGLTAQHCVTHNDEWLCEAYMKTDYSVLTDRLFTDTICNFLAYKIKYRRVTLNPQYKSMSPINLTSTNTWKYFKIKDLFPVIQNCKCQVARDLTDGEDCFYVGAKKDDNGVMKLVSFDKDLITKGNCIVFICDGQGSVGYANYMDVDFIGSTTLTVGYNKHLNKYIGMFLVTVLDLERPKYSFGRKYRTKLKETEIKLPATQGGLPDWDYMERYIKSLPYSDRI